MSRLIAFGENQMAIEVQLDPDMSANERTRRLEKAAEKIEYWQARNEQAAFFHDKRQRRKLRKAGIDLRRLRRCPLRI